MIVDFYKQEMLIIIRQEVNVDSVTEGTLTYLSAKEEHSGNYYCKGEEKRSTNDMPLMIFGKRISFKEELVFYT